jgi:prolyl oligopeptidase
VGDPDPSLDRSAAAPGSGCRREPDETSNSEQEELDVKRPLALLIPPLIAMASALPAFAAAPVAAPADPNQWLEDVTGVKSLDWVKAENERTTSELAQSDAFKKMQSRFLGILDSDARIPMVEKIGALYYNFWRDKDHPRGLWRRVTLGEYRKAKPDWETVLDLDSLGRAEKENWVWKGANALPPAGERCLISLSRGGADATVIREFDLKTRAFVTDGFVLPESKSTLSWKDKDHVYVGCAFDSSQMTHSGYANVVKEWARGKPLHSATLVYEGHKEDVGSGAEHDFTPGYERDFVVRGPTFFSNQLYLRRGTQLIPIEKPDDAEASAFRDWLLIRLRTDWKTGDSTWPAGALLAARFDDFLDGKRNFQVLFRPTERKSLAGYASLRSAIVLNELDNVKSRISVMREQGGRWSETPVIGLPEIGRIDVDAVDSYTSEYFWLVTTDFLTPTTLLIGGGSGGPEALKHSPAFFDGSKDAVSQHEAISKDGTRIPYFEVAPSDLKLDGSAPTVLTGYGGFEVPELPVYSGVRGSGWLEQGGVLVVANIRGGGEFGPRWHQAALLANRPRAYEDFIAVAEDLIQRKITSPRHLACMGGSNGGLLVGNMLTMRPDLWGAIVCQSPLLDMRRYHLLLAGASWMAEYGNPDDPKDWSFIQTFSPYNNVKADAKYPRVLFTSSTRDDRVHPAHARKMVAKMQAQGHDVLYYENTEGGHAGSATNAQQAFMTALEYSFLWKQLR